MIRKLCLVVALLAASLGAGMSPAHADHQYQTGVWDRAPAVGYDGVNVANVQDAAYYWEDRGFDGYIPPLPLWNSGGSGCATIYDGWIMACTVPRSIVVAYCGEPCDGTTRTQFDTLTLRMTGAFILIANDLTPYARQQVWRHEWGHSIGLGHTAGNSCVMYHISTMVPLGDGCPHDVWAIRDDMYAGDRF